MYIKIYCPIILLFVLSLFSSSCTDSHFIEVPAGKAYDINVEKVHNQRGVMILNNTYLLVAIDAKIIKGIDKLGVSDDAIWGIGKPPVPTLLNVPAPFRLIKKANNDSLVIISNLDTIVARMD